LLFEGTPIDGMNQNSLPLSTQNKTQQTKCNPYQSFVFGDYQCPITFNITSDPIGPIMTSILMAQTQVVANKAKEYGMNKLMPFTGN
jgi:hypothetical protein